MRRDCVLRNHLCVVVRYRPKMRSAEREAKIQNSVGGIVHHFPSVRSECPSESAALKAASILDLDRYQRLTHRPSV